MNFHIRRAGLSLLCLCLAALAGCASVPRLSDSLGHSSTAEKPQIVGRRGPLSNAEVKALTDRLTVGAAADAVLARHLAIEEAVAESPLVTGHTVRLLKDGPVTFRAMFAAIRSAKSQINLEYYIFDDVQSDGEQLSDLLIAKRAEGVDVNVIYDGYGSGETSKAYLDRLKAAGVQLVEYNPINPLKSKKGYAPNNRDHRKILVVDGATAIVGGVNLSTTYQVNPVGKSGAADGQPPEVWRDTDLEIVGPAAAELQTLFLDHWREQKGPALAERAFFPAVPAAGGAVVRVIGSAPGQGEPLYYVTLVSAIRSAEKSITASAAYFVPTEAEVKALVATARRGVAVRLLLPDRSDSAASIAVGHSHYADLLKAGVRIFETHGLVLHSKTVMVDGVWSMIGSSNFDHRSVVFNDEVDVVVLGGDTAQQLAAMFEDDSRGAKEIDLKTWNRRPLRQRIRELYSRAWQKFL